MGGSAPNPNKRHGPSFKEGRFRDPEVATAQDPDFQRDDLEALIKKAVKAARKPGA